MYRSTLRFRGILANDIVNRRFRSDLLYRTFTHRQNRRCMVQSEPIYRSQWEMRWSLLGGIACFVVAQAEKNDSESQGSKTTLHPPSSLPSSSTSSLSLPSIKQAEDEVVMSIKRGKLAEMKKDLKLAEDHYHNALALLVIYQKNKMWEESRIVQARVYVYDCMANLALVTGRLADAETLFKETLRGLMQLGRMQDDVEIIEISLKLAMIYAAEKKDADAIQGYSYCIESLEKKMKGAASVSENEEEQDNMKALLGMCVDAYSRFLIARSRYTEAIECLDRALMIARSVFGESHPQVAVLHNDMATVLSLQGDYSGARDHVQHAIQIGVATDSADLPVFHCNLASLYTSMNDLEASRLEYNKAMVAAKKHKDVDMENKAKDALKDLKVKQRKQ